MFTDRSLQALKPENQPYRAFDKGTVKGFGVQVTPAGGLFFFLQYLSPLSKKRKFLKLGQYPAISLARAREKARDAHKLIADNKDPQAEAKKNRRAERGGTVDDLIQGYTDQMKEHGKRSYKNVLRCLKKDVGSTIGGLPASAVEPEHVSEILFRVIERGAEVHANRLRSYMHAAFTYGIQHDNDPKKRGTAIKYRIKANPVANVPKDASVERVGERALDWAEIKTLWATDHPSLPTPIRLALKLMWATGGQRSSEIIEAPMEEFDLDRRVWEISPERSKNKQYHVVPLTDLAISLIAEIRDLYGDSGPWLFPSRLSPDSEIPMRHKAISDAVRDFCSKTGFEKFVPKDIRRTVKTRMGELKIRKDDRDRLQNHAKQDVSSKHYDRYDYLDEKQEAIKKWCDFLVRLVNDENVVPLKARVR